jgi:protoheme IX farnesyltransferase
VIYGVIAAICGALFLLLAHQLHKSGADRLAAHRLFLFSISYLFVLFAAVLFDRGGGSFPRTPAPQADRSGGRVHAEALPSAASGASSLITLSRHEV